MRVLIAGCGYVGTALADELHAAGDEVFGLRRSSPDELPHELPAGVTPIIADVTAAGTLTDLPDRLDAVVYAVSAGSRDPAAYQAAYDTGLGVLLSALGAPLPRLVYVSSTAVYGQTDGRVVDEDSPTEPARATARILLRGEARARAAGGVVLRLAGIYGPGRTRLLDEVRAGVATYPPAPSWTNRIHRDDAAGAIAHLLRLPDPHPIYVGADDDPADRREVVRWLASRLGAPPPREAPAAAGRGANKRCRNTRLRASGYTLRYPSFREGYTAIIGG